MAKKAVAKVPEKLTDSEKKKIKAANKAKANPKLSEEKAKKNLNRRICRGQEKPATADCLEETD